MSSAAWSAVQAADGAIAAHAAPAAPAGMEAASVGGVSQGLRGACQPTLVSLLVLL